ncbi:hepatic leukemia factor-like [Anneissia japonica]|uniref:hepatic leukemia factor-like n=1 Tax=Anneissia japonica TaxID=1529436 RepID=UPI0014258366|nr:hepatic leukemia factor-like [Anneissia japonica]
MAESIHGSDTLTLKALLESQSLFNPLSISEAFIANKNKSPAYPSREPSPVKVDIDFEPSITDVALATIPGQDTFDPRTASFNDDELKPQPMIKKSRKVYVPDEQKDSKYWERRRKNNFAAKRSRDARRVKENQIAICATYLQKENNAYRLKIQSLKKENLNLKKIIEEYETEMKLLNSLVK